MPTSSASNRVAKMRAEALPANPASALPRSAPYTCMSAVQPVSAAVAVSSSSRKGCNCLVQLLDNAKALDHAKAAGTII
eukprot:14705-Heterococcus_DN1.PRE.3